MALVTRAEVVAFAKITTELSADQTVTLDNFVAACLPEIERITGPLDLRSAVYRSGPRSGPLVLPWPYVSITSVTRDGVTIPAASYDAVTRADRGILDPSLGATPSWAWGYSIVVTAQIGNASTPANVKLAALELCTSWWQQTQQAQHTAFVDGGIPIGFAMPQRVLDHLAASPALPGFA